MRRPRAGTLPVLAVLLVVAAVAGTTSRPTALPTVDNPPSGAWTVLGAGGAEHRELPRLGGWALWCCPQNGIED
jgi:hypothetical protein